MSLYERKLRWRIFIQANPIRQEMSVDGKDIKKFSTIFMMLFHIGLIQFYEIEFSTHFFQRDKILILKDLASFLDFKNMI